MAVVNLISGEDLTTLTNIGGNVDYNRFEASIRNAQQLYLQPVLREELYEKIMSDYSTNSLSGNYLTIYSQYIYDGLAHMAAALYLAVGTYQFGDAGILQAVPDGTQAVSDDVVIRLEMNEKSFGEYYLRGLKNYLQNNRGDFPEYKGSEQGESIRGWYFPNEIKYSVY
jgi:hypothetical protein